MGATEFISAAIPILLSILVPGLALAVPLLRKTKLSRFEITCFAFAIGLVVPTTITYILNILGVPFSITLTLAGAAVTTAIGIAWYFYEASKDKQWLKFDVPEFWFNPTRDAIPIILFLIMFLAFFIRVQSFGPVFYEFDPYFYMYIARQLLVVGNVPLVDGTAWYPGPGGHGNTLLTGYLEAGWYLIYTGGDQTYSNLLLSTIANIYPPVVGAIICFFAYSFVKEEYGHLTGILAAGFMAFTPRLIEKFVAGEAEIAPWGMFSVFFFLSAYALAMTRKDMRFAILAGIAYMSAYFGSAYTLVIVVVFCGYSFLESCKLFLKNESLKGLLKANAIIFVFVVFSYLVRDTLYSNSLSLSSTLIMFIASLAFTGALYFIELNSKKTSTRYNMFLALVLVGAVFLFITPLFGILLSFVSGAVSFSRPTTALMQTVAEEHALTPQELVGDAKTSFGILGTAISGVSLWSENGQPVEIPFGVSVPNIIGGLLGGQFNEVYMPFLLLVVFIVLLAAIFTRNSHLALMFLVAVFPISFVGMQKSKYTIQFCFMLAIAAAVLLGELYKLLVSSAKDSDKKLYRQGYAVLVALLLIESSFGFVSLLTNGRPGPLTDIFPTAITFQPGDCAKVSESIKAGANRPLSAYMYCTKIPSYWLDPMDWISKNVHKDDAVMSWWDYGHWTNFFGDRRTVTRNEHANGTMDLMVADAFVEGTPEDLKNTMIGFNATHVMFDIDLVGKWGALKYLSCVYNEQTNMSVGPGSSLCDQLYDFEYMLVPVQPTLNERCIVKGKEGQYMQLGISTFGPTYCLGEIDIGGNKAMAILEANESNPPENFDTDPNVVKINRGIPMYMDRTGYNGRAYDRYLIAYPEIWYDGQPGLPDRKGKAYDSNFYRGFFLGRIDGFELVYPEGDPGGLMIKPVRIFKIPGS